ncbi:major capsid protein [Paenibacillus thiaminolyticus]|uniref:major capsid protein n=1 Tax=Paenibacillus thiaminolyticus TaxID=49283 RepID=UPI0023F65EA6|nr:major capsid protein [Paenibacillus thiaminolyticus]
MPSIFDLVNAKAIASYVTNNPSNKIPYLGATLLQRSKISQAPAAWRFRRRLEPNRDEGRNRDAILPRIHAHRREGTAGIVVAGRECKRCVYHAYDHQIFDDVANLVTGAEVIPERMIMQLISTGRIKITANRQDYDYDYKMSAEHKETLTGTAVWSSPESAPIQDIQKWQRKVEQDTGVKPTRAICSLDVWNALLVHPSIRLI